MRKYLFLLVILLANCLFGFAQTSSQTKTATYLNNLNHFQQVFGNQNYPRARVQDVAADDNIYTCTSKLTGEKDSGWTPFDGIVNPGFTGFRIHHSR